MSYYIQHQRRRRRRRRKSQRNKQETIELVFEENEDLFLENIFDFPKSFPHN
jgi:hypothetical protein